uniref:Uncharacterized protein n=1 Tax=Neogobius melanostomus TaxID=47308 RepID=A0A8C6WKY8_9GOBI
MASLNVSHNALILLAELLEQTRITALNLDGLMISKLTNLSGLVNLRWASFNDNDVSKVDGLDCCLKLEELSLNNNNITTVTGERQPHSEHSTSVLYEVCNRRHFLFLVGLLKLRSLNRLSLDGNQLTHLDASVLEQLPNLTFLSLDRNAISSLHGIQRVRPLLELYIGNNHVSTTRDIYYLKVSVKKKKSFCFTVSCVLKCCPSYRD